MFDALWQYFKTHYWNVRYQWYADQISEFYNQNHFRNYTTLCYAHKPNISESMNQFIHNFHKQHPESIPVGTVHPGDKDLLTVAERALTSYNLLGFKFQLLVTDFYIHDERLLPVYDLVRREDKILVFHAGTGPIANSYVGIKHFLKFIERYPDLRVQVAHLGSFEYREFFNLLKQYPNLYLDNAMILVDHRLFPAKFDLNLDILLEYQDRLMFGSDFPNIPYDFAESWNAIISMGFPREFYEKFFQKNAMQFYRL